MATALLILLTLGASISPLLTLAHLFQVKEWRQDRVREHLRREGVLRQLFGITRPIVVSVFGMLGVFGFLPWVTLCLITLTGANILQIILRRQPYPVWTKKAIALVTLTIVIDITLTEFPTSFLPLIPLFQPVALAFAWLLLSPLDAYLKRRIIAQASKLRLGHQDLTVIGITGSVGKTTTKELLAHLFAERTPLVTPGYVNAEVGVAKWLIEALDSRKSALAIVEMGAYRTGEIATLCSFTKPQIGVITFVGSQHRALFGSEEAVSQAKGELVRALPVDGHAFLNGDSPLCAKLAESAPCPVTKVGTGSTVDIEALDIEETPRGIRFRIDQNVFSVPLHGTHNVTNVLLAISVAEYLGMSRAEIQHRLGTFPQLPHTFSVRKERGVTILDDTHNSSAESVRAAVEWARTQPEEPKVLLTSGLIELGEDTDRVHSELGTLAREIFDRVVILHERSAREFQRGFEGDVEILSKDTPPTSVGALLVCTGRMSEASMKRLLPR